MSDIPIGSPPAPPGRHAAPRGWYPDPVDASRERYWDGWGWSRNTRSPENGSGAQLNSHLGGYPGAAPPAGQQGEPGDPYGNHDPNQTGTQYGQYGNQNQYGNPGQYGNQYGNQSQTGSQFGGQYGPTGNPYGNAYPQAPGPYPQAAQWAHVTGPRTADGVPLAGWGWRFLAGIVDLIITSIVASLFALPIYLKLLPALTAYINQSVAAAQQGGSPPTLTVMDLLSRTDQTLLSGISVAVGLLYFGLFWRFKGATPAQLLCGLRVVPVDQGRHTGGLPWARSLLRAVVWSVPITVGGYLYLIAILNALFPLWNPKRQAVHDLAARTQLVKVK